MTVEQDGKFYVYTHRRASNGVVFYVGKGHGRRAYVKSHRGKWWNDVVNKHGLIVTIEQESMSSKDAYLLEMWLIAKFRHEGIKLCNITDGGEGPSGIRTKGVLKVYCSNGMVFENSHSAIKWIKDNVNANAKLSTLNCASRGIGKSYCGLAWSVVGVPRHPYIPESNSQWAWAIQATMKKVVDGYGNIYESISSAARILRANGYPKAAQSGISRALSKEGLKSYGRTWNYENS